MQPSDAVAGPTDHPTDPIMVMQRICRDRHRAWSLLAELTDPTPEDWSVALADRLEGLGPATAWLDGEWRSDGVLLLQGLLRRANRRGPEDLLDLLQDATVAAQPGIGRLHRAVAEVQDLCTRELSAWDSADAETAKHLRIEQMSLLVPDSTIRAQGQELVAARLPVWSPVAQIVRDYLLLETGR